MSYSEWRIELSGKWQDTDGNKIEFPQLDFESVSDVVLQIRYAARDSGKTLRNQVLKEIKSALNNLVLADGDHGLVRVLSARREFSNGWHRFLNNYTLEPAVADPPKTGNLLQTLELDLAEDRFPFPFRGQMKMQHLWLFLKPKEALTSEDAETLALQVELKPAGRNATESGSDAITLQVKGSPIPGIAAGKLNVEVFGPDLDGFVTWTLQVRAEVPVKDGNPVSNTAALPEKLRKGVFFANSDRTGDPDYWQLSPDGLEDLYILCEYGLHDR